MESIPGPHTRFKNTGSHELINWNRLGNRNVFSTVRIDRQYIQVSDYIEMLHRKKKVREFPVPSLDVTTKLSMGGNNDVITELFLPRGSLVSGIPARDGKLANLFLRCICYESLAKYIISDLFCVVVLKSNSFSNRYSNRC